MDSIKPRNEVKKSLARLNSLVMPSPTFGRRISRFSPSTTPAKLISPQNLQTLTDGLLGMGSTHAAKSELACATMTMDPVLRFTAHRDLIEVRVLVESGVWLFFAWPLKLCLSFCSGVHFPFTSYHPDCCIALETLFRGYKCYIVHHRQLFVCLKLYGIPRYHRYYPVARHNNQEQPIS